MIHLSLSAPALVKTQGLFFCVGICFFTYILKIEKISCHLHKQVTNDFDCSNCRQYFIRIKLGDIDITTAKGV